MSEVWNQREKRERDGERGGGCGVIGGEGGERALHCACVYRECGQRARAHAHKEEEQRACLRGSLC